MDGPTTSLARFVSELRYDDLPTNVRNLVKTFTIDAIASAIAGRSGDEMAQVEGCAVALFGNGSATVLGGAQRLSPAGAVLVNGYQTTSVALCDVFRPARCHVTPEVVPPALAIAEREHSDGASLLTAVAAGLETTTRIGLAAHYPAMRARGWHPPGILGPFGAAAAAGKLLCLDAEQQRNAFGLAGSQAAGTFAQWGTATIKFHQARGALSGFLSAGLASTGFSAAPEVLVDPDGGLFNTYSDGGSPEHVTADLGTEWCLTEISLRRWPAASPLQTLLTSIFHIVASYDVDPKQVANIRIAVSKAVYDSHAEVPWTTPSKAQMSIPYVAAVMVNERACWVDHFLPERVADRAIDEFARERIEVRHDDGLDGGSCLVEIELSDGALLQDRRSIPKGDPRDALTIDDVAGKFQDAARGALPPGKAEDVLERLLRLEEVADVAALTSLLHLEEVTCAR